jgi:hypothetical protein
MGGFGVQIGSGPMSWIPEGDKRHDDHDDSEGEE